MTRSERGALAATIDRVAREEHVAHIIMGTRGLGGVRGLLLGSVTTQLLHLAGVPGDACELASSFGVEPTR